MIEKRNRAPETLRIIAGGPSPYSCWSDTAIVAADRAELQAHADRWDEDLAEIAKLRNALKDAMDVTLEYCDDVKKALALAAKELPS